MILKDLGYGSCVCYREGQKTMGRKRKEGRTKDVNEVELRFKDKGKL